MSRTQGKNGGQRYAEAEAAADRLGPTGGYVLLPKATALELLRANYARWEREGRSFSYRAKGTIKDLIKGRAAWDFADLWVSEVPKTARPLCGARTRKGTPCRARAVEGRQRCRLHGGMSTGPKTEAGKAAIAESNRRRAGGQHARQKVEW